MNPRCRNNTEISKHNRKRKMPLDLGPQEAVLDGVEEDWMPLLKSERRCKVCKEDSVGNKRALQRDGERKSNGF